MFPFLKKKEEPVIHFVFSEERMTWKDLKIWRRITSGKSDEEELQLFAAHFMVDKDGKYLQIEKAVDILDNLPVLEIKDVLQKFTEAITESAVPKAKPNSSNLPLEASLAAKSQTG